MARSEQRRDGFSTLQPLGFLKCKLLRQWNCIVRCITKIAPVNIPELWKYRIPPELLLFEFVGDRKLVTSLAAAAGQHLAAIGRLHTLAETMNGLPATTMGLKCTFHFVKALSRCCKIGRENGPVTHSIHRSPHP